MTIDTREPAIEDIVDLSQFKVKLKTDFQGSNRDMYRPEAVVASSTK